jgi:hypothetical protein
MTAKCDVCAIPYGETVCVTCGNGPRVETALGSSWLAQGNLKPGELVRAAQALLGLKAGEPLPSAEELEKLMLKNLDKPAGGYVIRLIGSSGGHPVFSIEEYTPPVLS